MNVLGIFVQDVTAIVCAKLFSEVLKEKLLPSPMAMTLYVNPFEGHGKREQDSFSSSEIPCMCYSFTLDACSGWN